MPVFFSSLDLLGAATSPWAVFAFIIQHGGLILFYPVLVWMCLYGWREWIQNKYTSKKKFVLLAIDVPKLNEQSMKAVEQIMAALHGVHFNPNFKERNWIGVVLDKFSFEIVSIDGYIQYFVHGDDYNADLVKGAIYAQYPDAEIIEVEDYVHNMPHDFPDEQYEMWGTEFVLAKEDVYPIKTYEYFEHPLTGVFADPMAAILEILSRLRPGEQVWLQFVITPEGITWREKGVKEVNELIEKKIKAKRGLTDMLSDAPLAILHTAHDAVFTAEREWVETAEEQESQGNFLNMTTGEKVVVEEVQKKISRIPWKTKFRFCYFAPKEIYNSYRVVGSVFGVFKQFNTLDLNAIIPGSKLITSGPVYFFVQRRQNWRKHKLVRGYRERSNDEGEESYVLSNVELATLIHFPIDTVRAPMVSKTEAKKSEPPAHLPLENMPFGPLEELPEELPVQETPTAAASAAEVAPVNLHSMEGLPPGVQPVQHPTIATVSPLPSHPSQLEIRKPQPPTIIPGAQPQEDIPEIVKPSAKPIGTQPQPQAQQKQFGAPEKKEVPPPNLPII